MNKNVVGLKNMFCNNLALKEYLTVKYESFSFKFNFMYNLSVPFTITQNYKIVKYTGRPKSIKNGTFLVLVVMVELFTDNKLISFVQNRAVIRL